MQLQFNLWPGELPYAIGVAVGKTKKQKTKQNLYIAFHLSLNGENYFSFCLGWWNFFFFFFSWVRPGVNPTSSWILGQILNLLSYNGNSWMVKILSWTITVLQPSLWEPLLKGKAGKMCMHLMSKIGKVKWSPVYFARMTPNIKVFGESSDCGSVGYGPE